jgi:predicted GIY-YIG superfamily endonuclease
MEEWILAFAGMTAEVRALTYYVYILASRKRGTLYIGVTNTLYAAFMNTRAEPSKASPKSITSIR